MNKAAIASLFALSAFTVAPALVSHSGAAFAQAPAATGQVQMQPDEFAVYDNCMSKQTTPQTQAPCLEDYLTKYPKSSVRTDVLQRIMLDYSAFNPAKAIDAADNYLAVSPNNLQAYLIEVAYRKAAAQTPNTPAATMQAGLDQAATFAKKGLDVLKGPKPPVTEIPADQYQKIVDIATPTFYGAIADDARSNKDGAAAVDAYKSELAAMKPDQLTTPAALQEVFYLGASYMLLNPPDYTDCAFYTTRAAALAPDQFKPQLQPTANYCYKKQHGATDGYDAVVTAAKANPNPPAGFAISPAPTDADQANWLMDGNPKATPPTPRMEDADIPKMAFSDREYVLQYASDANKARVWDAFKGKSSQIPDTLVIESSPTVLKVAVSDDAKQAKKADYTFNIKPLEAPEEPKAKTAVALAKYNREKKAYDKQVADIAAATAVGQTVTLQGTYSSFTPNPIMIIMDDGEVVLPKAEPAAKPAARPAARH